jgi:hypothetical protein
MSVQLGDVFSAYRDYTQGREIFGTTAEAAQSAQDAFTQIGAVLMEEQGITEPGEAVKMPHSTVLGEKAQTAFEEFKKVVADKPPSD